MIGSLRGKLALRSGLQLVLDVNGVGYELTVSSSVVDQCGDLGSEQTVVVYTDVKENSIALYGFTDQLEKQVFLLLKKVKGIGSRLALNIISSLGPERLLANIGQGDLSALKQVPGIGKKTAERLIVELKESVLSLVSQTDDISIAPSSFARTASGVTLNPSLGNKEQDAILALEKLGFTPQRAQQAVSLALALPEMEGKKVGDSGDLLRLALSQLSQLS